MSIFSAPSFYSQADQDIYNRGFSFVPTEPFRKGAFNFPTEDDNTGGVTTVPVNSFTGGGGGGGAAFTGGVNDLTTAFQKTIDDRQNRLTELNRPLTTSSMLGMDSLNQKVMDKIRSDNLYGDREALSKYTDKEYMQAFPEMFPNQSFPGTFQEKPTINRRIQDAFYSIPGLSKPQSAEQIMEEGYTGKAGGPGILGAILGSIDKFATLPRPDQAFIASQMGYTGPTVFGQNQSGLSKDPFGLNTRSGFGNYAERVGTEATGLRESLSGRLTDKYRDQFGLTTDEELSYDPVTGQYIGSNRAAVLKANQMTKLMRTKQQYYLQKTNERNEFREQEKARQEAAFQAQLNRQQRDQRQRDLSTIEEANRAFREGRDDGYSDGSAGEQSDGSYNDPFDPGGGEKDGGFIDGTNRRMDFMMGGLADLVDIYD
jgi:hypothetical protein